VEGGETNRHTKIGLSQELVDQRRKQTGSLQSRASTQSGSQPPSMAQLRAVPKQAHLTTSPARWTRTLHSCASPFLVGEGRSQEWMSEESIRTTHMKMAKAGRVPQNTTRRWSTNNRCPISTIDASFTSIQLGCTEAEDAQPPTPALSHLFFLQTHEQPFPFQQDLVPPKATTSLEKSTDYQHHFLAPSPFLQDPNMKFPPTLPPTSENPNSCHLPSICLPPPFHIPTGAGVVEPSETVFPSLPPNRRIHSLFSLFVFFLKFEEQSRSSN